MNQRSKVDDLLAQLFATPNLPCEPDEEQATVVFSVEEESSSGGTSYCWVERRVDGYHFMGVETGHMGGPYDTALSALCCDGWQFGMDYVTIKSSLPADEFRQALGNVIMENVAVMRVNGVEHKSPTVEAVVATYKPG